MSAQLTACHECDLLQYETPLPPGGVARCGRCGGMLYRSQPDSIDRALAYTLGGIVLFLVANFFPVVGLQVGSDLVQTTLFGTVRALYDGDMRMVAVLVAFTTIVTPTVELAAMAYLLVPLKLNRVPRHAGVVFRALGLAKPWGMIEVFMLGVMVALVKLAHLAGVVPGIAMWSFFALMMLLAAASAAFDPRELWLRVQAVR